MCLEIENALSQSFHLVLKVVSTHELIAPRSTRQVEQGLEGSGEAPRTEGKNELRQRATEATIQKGDSAASVVVERITAEEGGSYRCLNAVDGDIPQTMVHLSSIVETLRCKNV